MPGEQKASMTSGKKIIVTRLTKILNWVALTSLWIMVLLTTLDVIMRQFGMPILGTYEVIGFLGFITVAFALAQTTLNHGHVAVKVLMSKLSPPVQNIINKVTLVFSLILFALISWQSAVFATKLWHIGEVSPTLRLPFYTIIYGMAFSSAIVCLVILVDLLKTPRGKEGTDRIRSENEA